MHNEAAMPRSAQAAVPGPAMTISRVLSIPVVRRGLPEVVSGQGDLDRVIRWTHVIDLPDPRRLLRGDELVLTTGVAIPDDEAGQRLWVKRVVDQGAGALAIELGFAYDRAAPAPIVAACREHKLPLIVFHRRVAFVELMEAIDLAIMDGAATVARRADAVHDRLVELLLADQDITRVLDALATDIRAPVILETGTGELVHCALAGAPMPIVTRALADIHRFTDAIRDEDAHIVELFRHGGRVIALGLDGPLDSEQRAIVTRATRVLALDHSTRTQAIALNLRSKGLLLSDLIDQHTSEYEATERAALLGFSLPDGEVLTTVARHRRTVNTQPLWTRVMPALRVAFDARSCPALIGLSDEYLLAVTAPLARDDADPRDALARLLRHVIKQEGADPDEIVVVIGTGARGWTQLGFALARARRRAQAVASLDPRPWFDAKGSDALSLLHDVEDSMVLARYVDEQLGPLIDGGARAGSLLETLRVLIQEGGRKASAARALHLNRSALYLRLERIERMLDASLDDPRTILSLHLALEAQSVLQQRSTPRR
jgi:PucR family transcriptional regulator, purine catabolism regulatory protein